MTSIANKIKRKQELLSKRNVNTQLNMFDRIPDKCDTCHLPFDKKSKEMAKTWFVVVKQTEKVVRLFCPECMNKAKKAVEDASVKHETEIVQEGNGV